MAEIIYNPTIQDGCKAEIEKHLVPFLWLVPNWVLFLNVNLLDSTSDNCGELATVTVDYDYRRITIDVATAWLDRTEDEKSFALVHELLHGYFALIADYARDAIHNLCPKDEAEKFNASMIKELTTRHEATTQDLAFAILNKFNER